MSLRFEDSTPVVGHLTGTDFQLTLDTSDLPEGRLEFDIDRFVERVQAAVEEGRTVIHLDRESALEWGLRFQEHDDA